MSGPVEQITVSCPACGHAYVDWTRGSINLDLEGWNPDDPETIAYLRECETAKCPACGHVVELAMLVVSGGVWTFR